MPDFDAHSRLLGIEVEHASKWAYIPRFVRDRFPAKAENAAAMLRVLDVSAETFRVAATSASENTSCRQFCGSSAHGVCGSLAAVPDYQFTEYFERIVLSQRPYLRKAWCLRVLQNPLREEQQEDGRWRFWGMVPEFGYRYLRVVTLPDRVTILNAFPDRRFRP